jgi:hypothetical protein
MESSQNELPVLDSIGGGVTGQSGGKSDPKQQLWLNRIKLEQRAHKDFRDRSEIVEEVYKRDSNQELYVPLFWQVVSVEHSGVYSNQPVPDVRPRNDPQNPIMREVSQILERGLAYCTDQASFDNNMNRVVDDYLAIGLGVPRVKVDSVIEEEQYEEPIMGMGMVGMDQTGNPMMGAIEVGVETRTEEVTKDQSINWVYVPWNCFGWEPCNNWKDCDFIYFRHPMTQKQIRKRWDRDVSASSDTMVQQKDPKIPKTYDVYEIWDKTNREVLFIAAGESEPLEVIPDPLELKGFYPIPAPMLMNLGSDSLIPQSDYDYIEAYDVEINRLQIRRMGILEQIRATGAYDSGMAELGDMMENDDGEYTPVANLMQRIQSAGGKDGVIYHLPMQEKSIVLQTLTEQIQFVRSQVDEVLGISDIVRGVTAASETATAQEIKGRWVGVRLTRKRECVQYTIREMMRIMAQLLGSHITPENLKRMTQMNVSEQALQILQDDVLMQFAVDIETDSTVAKDEFREMQTKQEMLNGVAQYSQSVLPMVQQNQMPAGMASAILRSALAPYAKYDRNLEEEMATLPETMGQLQKLNGEMQQVQQQLQQAQQQAQQWQMVATDLQNKATEAASQQKMADAQKKGAETQKIISTIPDEQLQPEKTVAQTDLTKAQTLESMARARDLMEGEDDDMGERY